MKKYYWSIEDNRVISLEELDTIRQATEPETPLAEYVEKCSYKNNGDLEPLDMEIQRELKTLEELHDDIRTITESIIELEKLVLQIEKELN